MIRYDGSVWAVRILCWWGVSISIGLCALPLGAGALRDWGIKTWPGGRWCSSGHSDRWRVPTHACFGWNRRPRCGHKVRSLYPSPFWWTRILGRWLGTRNPWCMRNRLVCVECFACYCSLLQTRPRWRFARTLWWWWWVIPRMESMGFHLRCNCCTTLEWTSTLWGKDQFVAHKPRCLM